MTYIQGFVVPVKPGRKDAYREMAAKAAPIFADYGATRTVECWGEDLPDGKRTDFRRAVKAEDGEGIAFSWIFWPDKATCDAAAAKMMDDERMKPDGDMPFDMRRMIYGGYEVASDSGDGGPFGYIDGMVASVSEGKRQAFVDHAAFMAAKLKLPVSAVRARQFTVLAEPQEYRRLLLATRSNVWRRSSRSRCSRSSGHVNNSASRASRSANARRCRCRSSSKSPVAFSCAHRPQHRGLRCAWTGGTPQEQITQPLESGVASFPRLLVWAGALSGRDRASVPRIGGWCRSMTSTSARTPRSRRRP